MSKALDELKRIRQETCPATYMQDFDKEKSCDIIEQELKRLEQFNKYITNLYNHRNDYETKNLYEFEIDNAVIRASTIEEIYNKFKEVLENDSN